MKLIELIRQAEERKIAIPHFNVGNFEQLKAVANIGIKLNIPIIIGVSEGEREYWGLAQIVSLIKSYNESYSKEGGFHLYLNADHTHSIEKIQDAVRAGFDAVLFDGGKLPLHENIALTKEAVIRARSINSDIVIEGELGYIGSSSEIFSEIPKGAEITNDAITSVSDAMRLVKETGIDLLAPAVGNVHGMFANAQNPHLFINRIEEIKREVPVSLVLHGGSGTPDDDFIKAIDAGVSIIHISTELRYAWRKTLDQALKERANEVAPSKLMPGVIEVIEEVAEKRARLFGRI